MLRKPTIGVIIENGCVQRVVSDNIELCGCNVVVLHDSEPAPMKSVSFDDEIVGYLQRAADLAACGGMSIACELASEALFAFSRENHTDPRVALQKIERIMSALASALVSSQDAGSIEDHLDRL